MLIPLPYFIKSKASMGMKALVAQLCLTLCDPMDWSPPDSSIHGIFQAKILEWVAMPFSRGFFQPRDWTQVSCIAGRFFTSWATNLVVLWKPNSWHTFRAFEGGGINTNKSIYQDHTLSRNPNCHLLRLKNLQDAIRNHSSWQLSRSQEEVGMAKSYSKFQQFWFLSTPISSRAAVCNHSQNSISLVKNQR